MRNEGEGVEEEISGVEESRTEISTSSADQVLFLASFCPFSGSEWNPIYGVWKSALVAVAFRKWCQTH